jgi:hypothetical protein
MATKKKAKKRRRRQPAGKQKKGVMIGMRSGFKSLAKSAQQSEETGKGGVVSALITVGLIIAAAAILYYRS